MLGRFLSIVHLLSKELRLKDDDGNKSFEELGYPMQVAYTILNTTITLDVC